ncbi:GGDEF domain-containing protein [Thermodesulfobacteriota bacterium]
MFSFKRTIYPFIIPALIIILAAITIWQWPALMRKVNEVEKLRAFLVILPVMPYAVFFISILMGWRFNNAGLILAATTLALSYFVFSRFGLPDQPQKAGGLSIQEATVVLLPLNLAVLSIMTKRRLLTSTGFICVMLIILQVFFLALFCPWPGSRLLPLISKASPLLADKIAEISIYLGAIVHRYNFGLLKTISTPSIITFCATLIFFLIRFLLTHETMLVGFAATLVATFLGITANQPDPSNMVYFSAAGLILIISTVETSFSMAYVDDLTGLQGRRSLNETLINLGHRYAIAMIDVDHFKKFNDTYGHDTGDQVLKMIASKLEKISGSAKTFRYGGEEFAAIFSGKSADEALPHLEKYRQTIASIPFVVRGKPRRKGKSKNRGQVKRSGQKQVKVTVSIGVAEPDKYATHPEKVLKAADKNLYKAKKSGRNRVTGGEQG